MPATVPRQAGPETAVGAGVQGSGDTSGDTGGPPGGWEVGGRVVDMDASDIDYYLDQLRRDRAIRRAMSAAQNAYARGGAVTVQPMQATPNHYMPERAIQRALRSARSQHARM